MVLHTSHTAVCVCVHSETKRRQLPEFQKEECDDSDQTDFQKTWGHAGLTLTHRCCDKLLHDDVFERCIAIYCNESACWREVQH